MKQPMSSYLVALVIGKYNKTIETSKTGIPLELYYYPEDSANKYQYMTSCILEWRIPVALYFLTLLW